MYPFLHVIFYFNLITILKVGREGIMISLLEVKKYAQSGRVICQDHIASKLGGQDMDQDLLTLNLISLGYTRLLS